MLVFVCRLIIRFLWIFLSFFKSLITNDYVIFPCGDLTLKRLKSVRQKTLVLDLDETLVHSNHNGLLDTSLCPDFIVEVPIDHNILKFKVFKRPYVDLFLETVSQWYDVVIFTASMEIYGSAVIKKLDKYNVVRKCFYRSSCLLDSGFYTKNLSILNKDLADVIIIDNSPYAYKNFINNAIPITSWFSDSNDTELLNLLPFLDALRFVSNVQNILKLGEKPVYKTTNNTTISSSRIFNDNEFSKSWKNYESCRNENRQSTSDIICRNLPISDT